MHDAADGCRVVVVGAGPSGSIAALLLGQYGIDCLVLDRWQDVYPQPRAVHLDDEVYRILGNVGLADAFARISRPGRGLRLVDRDITVLAEFGRDPDRSVHGYPQANMFDQPDLERLLRRAIDARDKVTMRGGCEVLDVADAGDHVLLTYRDVETGEKHTLTADYVLGCDGANSVVRSSIGSRMQDLGFEQRWLVVDIATDRELDQWEGVHQVCDTRRAATYMRIGPSRYRWEFRLHDHETAADFADIAAVEPMLRPWLSSNIGRDDLTLVRSAEYTFRARVVDRWRDRRILLLGDAAHLTPPFIGQGMGAGLRDAHNLAWKLAAVLGGAPDSVLDSYQAERKPHVTNMIRLAVAIGLAMTGGGAVSDVVRRRVIPVLLRMPLPGIDPTDSASPRLKRSDFVLRSRPGDLAGSLSPNGVVDDRRLDDVAGGRFVFVSTTTLSREQRSEVERRGAVVAEVPASSDIGVWLRRGHAAAAIVRPDGTVMAAGKSVPALHTRVPSIVTKGNSSGR